MSRLILGQLNDAESALRENLHRHDLDPTARAHMERALSHVREAYVATNEVAKARTVQQLAGDLDKFDRLLEKVRHRESPGVVTLKLRS
ncbi:MAG: hypothetical protein L0Z50_30130 [Verrucomicrobiales bacterium]|nr:hypothetical protein [Verrucomicrobiales bacterium]